MRTVIVKVSGEPKIGDRVMVTSTHRERGGASTVYHLVTKPREEIIYLDQVQYEDPETGELRMEADLNGRKEVRTHPQTLENVVDGLVAAMNGQNSMFISTHFQAKKRNATEFVIQASDTMNDNDFYAYVENLRGPGVQINLEVL